jgi:hypothetical protein
MDVGGAIVAGTAVYAAGLSTWLAVQQWRDRSPRVKVSLTLGVAKVIREEPLKIQLFSALPGNPRPQHLILAAQNTGRQDVTLGGFGFVVPDGKHFLPDHPLYAFELPHRISPGEAYYIWMSAHEVARNLHDHGFAGKIQLIGYYLDQLSHKYRAKPFEFDVDAWGAEADSES